MSCSIIPILDFSVVEVVGKLEPPPRNHHFICLGDCHFLFAWIVHYSYFSVVYYVLHIRNVVCCSCHLDLSEYFVKSSVHLRSTTETVRRKEIGLCTVGILQIVLGCPLGSCQKDC